MKKNKYKLRLLEDILMVALGIGIAVVLAKFGIFEKMINSTNDYILASFIAGIFFTSVFTLAPASIALIQIAEKAPIDHVIFIGALGALLGDLLLFYFIRDRFGEDVKKIMKFKTLKHFFKSFHFGFLKWLSPLLGALIIASPLPDEFGISLLGMSKVKMIFFIPISFAMNALGIYLLVLFAQFVQ